MTNRHPHADLIKQMVDDDTLRATCESAPVGCRIDVVIAYPNYPWRLVPPKPKTITITVNGKMYELPEPMRVAPDFGSAYFRVHMKDAIRLVWDNLICEMQWLKNGDVHATREAAQQWVDAMAEIRGAK